MYQQGVIKSNKLKKGRQYNGKKRETKDKQLSTKNYTENYKFNNTNHTKNWI
jgi:hypothetical protein